MNPPKPTLALRTRTLSGSWLSGMVRGRSDRSSSTKIPLPSPATAVHGSVGDTAGAGLGDSFSPISRKNQFIGVMFKYGRNPIQVAFKTGDFKQHLIFIGGLMDGFLATEYLQPLAIALMKEKWSLVQLLLSSSYTGYGISSLKQDAMDLDQLISYLINKENSEGVVLLGHSTGCQNIVYYMRTTAACNKAVRGAILQAPVSNREYRASIPETAGYIDLALKLISEGRGLDLMPRNADPNSPITAYRYHSLCAYIGDDDMFSSDLSDDQLKQRLGHMCTTPSQIIYSMADEYVADDVDKKSLVDRLCRAMGGAVKVEIEWGKHCLSNRVEEVVQAVLAFLKREGPCGWDDPWS